MYRFVVKTLCLQIAFSSFGIARWPWVASRSDVPPCAAVDPGKWHANGTAIMAAAEAATLIALSSGGKLTRAASRVSGPNPNRRGKAFPMSDDWKITEHAANVAAQFADRWATAVAAQARRIQRPENTLERVPDAWVQVSVLRQLLRAAQMAQESSGTQVVRQRIQDAIDAFIEAVVVETTMTERERAFKLARDALEHFDEYYRGVGDEQQRNTRRRDRSPREDEAQRFRVDLDGPADGALRLRIGPLRPAKPLVVIDLVEHAPRAARQLVRALSFGDAGWAPL